MTDQNKSLDAFNRLLIIMAARKTNVFDWGLLAAMCIACTRQQYQKELPGQDMDKFHEDLMELSYKMDAFISIPSQEKKSEQERVKPHNGKRHI